jgi:hypothetical protein
MSPSRRQGAVLIAGAALLYAAVEIGGLPFHWTPLLVGLAYLAAAVSAGPQGSYWPPAVVVCAWGLGVVLIAERVIDVSPDAGYLLAVGIGATVAVGLARAGYAVTDLGIAATILAAGAIFALQPRVDALGRASTFAAAVALLGLARLGGPERRARTAKARR